MAKAKAKASAAKTKRFCISVSEAELTEIKKWCARTGVSRNELMRRGALAKVRSDSDSEISMEDAWEHIGAEDEESL